MIATFLSSFLSFFLSFLLAFDTIGIKVWSFRRHRIPTILQHATLMSTKLQQRWDAINSWSQSSNLGIISWPSSTFSQVKIVIVCDSSQCWMTPIDESSDFSQNQGVRYRFSRKWHRFVDPWWQIRPNIDKEKKLWLLSVTAVAQNWTYLGTIISRQMDPKTISFRFPTSWFLGKIISSWQDNHDWSFISTFSELSASFDPNRSSKPPCPECESVSKVDIEKVTIFATPRFHLKIFMHALKMFTNDDWWHRKSDVYQNDPNSRQCPWHFPRRPILPLVVRNRSFPWNISALVVTLPPIILPWHVPRYHHNQRHTSHFFLHR
jgi:hypothetical protein